MADWSALLEHLASGPREDGTPELAAAAGWLAAELQRRGLTVEHFEWTAYPWRLRTVGIVAALAAATYVFGLLKGKRWLAGAVALAVPLWLIAELDFGIPLLGSLHSAPQENLIVTLPPASGAATSRLVFSAHYDTKTDFLDHLQRAPLTLLGLPLAVIMLWATLLRPRRWLTRVAMFSAAFNGVGQLAAYTGGALVASRSPGAIDDGAGCAVLIELASTLRAQPLEHTEVRLVFFSGEEISLQGSSAWVAKLDRSLPTRVVNLDGVGESANLAHFRSESGLLRSFHYDPVLVEDVRRISKSALDRELFATFYPAATDARSFLAAGIPAVSLMSDLPGHAIPRGFHSSADNRSRVDASALDATLLLLVDVANAFDASRPR